MKDSPFGITTYCDDIRYELGGKLTLVGCYIGEMTAYGTAPIMLPTFCALVNFRASKALNFTEISVVLSQDTNGVIKELAKASLIAPENSSIEVSDSEISETQLALSIPFKLTALVVGANCFIRCRAYIDDIEVKLGSIAINIAEISTMNPELDPFTPATSAPHTPRP